MQSDHDWISPGRPVETSARTDRPRPPVAPTTPGGLGLHPVDTTDWSTVKPRLMVRAVAGTPGPWQRPLGAYLSLTVVLPVTLCCFSIAGSVGPSADRSIDASIDLAELPTERWPVGLAEVWSQAVSNTTNRLRPQAHRAETGRFNLVFFSGGHSTSGVAADPLLFLRRVEGPGAATTGSGRLWWSILSPRSVVFGAPADGTDNRLSQADHDPAVARLVAGLRHVTDGPYPPNLFSANFR